MTAFDPSGNMPTHVTVVTKWFAWIYTRHTRINYEVPSWADSADGYISVGLNHIAAIRKILQLVISPPENTNKTNLTRVCLEADPQVRLSGPFFTAFPAFMPAQTNNKGVCFNHAKKEASAILKLILQCSWSAELSSQRFQSSSQSCTSALNIWNRGRLFYRSAV